MGKIWIKNRNTSFRTHKVKNGDSWISIANRYTDDNGHIRERQNDDELPLNYEQLAYWNGFRPGEDPVIKRGDKVYLEDPYILNAVVKKADAPKDFKDYGQQGQQNIAQVGEALLKGDMRWKDLPESEQTAALQYLMSNSNRHNRAASLISNAMGALVDPAAYAAWYAGTKGGAAVNDKLSGRNEYSTKQLLDPTAWTPILGRKYAAQNPTAELLLEAGMGGMPQFANGVINTASKIPQAASSAVAYTKQAAKDWNTGLTSGQNTQRMTLTNAASPHNPGRLAGFSSTKGNGQFVKTGFNRSPEIRIGPRPGEEPIIPTGTVLQKPTPATPWVVPISNVPVTAAVKETPEPHNSIYEQYAISRWQLPNPDPQGRVVPVSGPATDILSAYATNDGSWSDKSLHNGVQVRPATDNDMTQNLRRAEYSDEDTSTMPYGPSIGLSGLGTKYGEGSPSQLPDYAIHSPYGLRRLKQYLNGKRD